MGKQDPYRFNLAFDETDEDHRRVAEHLNSCGRKKARFIVKAVLEYWRMQEGGVTITPKAYPVKRGAGIEKTESESHFVEPSAEGAIDEAEISLMRKNFEMFEEWD